MYTPTDYVTAGSEDTRLDAQHKPFCPLPPYGRPPHPYTPHQLRPPLSPYRQRRSLVADRFAPTLMEASESRPAPSPPPPPPVRPPSLGHASPRASPPTPDAPSPSSQTDRLPVNSSSSGPSVKSDRRPLPRGETMLNLRQSPTNCSNVLVQPLKSSDLDFDIDAEVDSVGGEDDNDDEFADTMPSISSSRSRKKSVATVLLNWKSRRDRTFTFDDNAQASDTPMRRSSVRKSIFTPRLRRNRDGTREDPDSPFSQDELGEPTPRTWLGRMLSRGRGRGTFRHKASQSGAHGATPSAAEASTAFLTSPVSAAPSPAAGGDSKPKMNLFNRRKVNEFQPSSAMDAEVNQVASRGDSTDEKASSQNPQYPLTSPETSSQDSPFISPPPLPLEPEKLPLNDTNRMSETPRNGRVSHWGTLRARIRGSTFNASLKNQLATASAGSAARTPRRLPAHSSLPADIGDADLTSSAHEASVSTFNFRIKKGRESESAQESPWGVREVEDSMSPASTGRPTFKLSDLASIVRGKKREDGEEGEDGEDGEDAEYGPFHGRESFDGGDDANEEEFLEADTELAAEAGPASVDLCHDEFVEFATRRRSPNKPMKSILRMSMARI